MSKILADWVNTELALSQPVAADELDSGFRSGYLFGEVLQKLHVHDQLAAGYVNSASLDALIKNYTSLERTLRQKLDIKLSSNYALDIINGKRGAAAKLLYQIKSSAAAFEVSAKQQEAAAAAGAGAAGAGAGRAAAHARVALQPAATAADTARDASSFAAPAAGPSSRAKKQRAATQNARPGSPLVSYPSTPVGPRKPSSYLREDAKHTFHAKEDEFFEGMLKAKLKRYQPDPNAASNPKLPVKMAASAVKKSDMPPAGPGISKPSGHDSTRGHNQRNDPNAAQPHRKSHHSGRPSERASSYQFREERASSAESDEPSQNHRSPLPAVQPPHDQLRRLKDEKKEMQMQMRRREVISTMGRDISKFETKLELSVDRDDDDMGDDFALGVAGRSSDLDRLRSPPDPAMISFIQQKARMSPVQHMKLLSRLVPPQDQKYDQTSKYLDNIRIQRVEEEYSRKDREQRRRKIILSHQQAQQEMEKKHFEDLVLSKLMRQSKQERRIAEQLMQARHEKEVMHENRVFREKQYAERRQKDYEDAIAREYELCERARQEYREQMAQQLAQHREILAAKQAAKHEKNMLFCRGLFMEIIDLSFKVAEYRVLNDNKDVPPTKMREWKTLFTSGESVNKPIIVEIENDRIEPPKDEAAEKDAAEIPSQPVEDMSAIKVLDDSEISDYINNTGLWSTTSQEPVVNPLLGVIVEDIITLTAPPETTYEVAPLPSAPLRVVIIGKRFAGKSSIAKRIADTYNMSILRIDDLMKEAISVSDPAPKKAASDKDKTASDGKESKDGKSAKKTLTKPQIGAKIQLAMLEGQSPDDSLLVALIIDALSQQPPKSGGWIVVDFPRTRVQAQLLERELSGYEDPKPVKKGDLKRPKDKDKSASKNRSLIAPSEGQSDAASQAPASGLDCVLLLEIDNEVAISRSAGQRLDPIMNKVYHLELDPPPKNAPGTFERLAHVEDESKSRSQLQYQLAAFEDEEDTLKDWFNRFRILKTVDANQTPEKTADMAQGFITEVIETKEQERRDKEGCGKSDEAPGSAHGGEGGDFLSDGRDERADDGHGKQGSARSRGLSAGAKMGIQPSASGQAVGQAQQQQLGQPLPAGAANPGGASGAAAGHAAGADKGGQRVTSPNEAAIKNKNQLAQPNAAKDKDPKRQASAGIPADSAPADATLPAPATGDIVGEPIAHHVVRTTGPHGRKVPSKELAEVLMDQWTTLESTYTDVIKFTFRSLRREQESILRFFFETKTNFKKYLERPDARQELVELFQAEYNAVEDDLRSDPDAKSELHQRVEDLRDRLWEMSDKKREEAEAERISIIEDRWIEDHSYILANTYITMMQAELDRYLSTRQIVLDYFRDAYGLPLADMARPQVRIALIAPASQPPVEITSTLVTAHEAQAAQRREGAQSATAGGSGAGAAGAGGAGAAGAASAAAGANAASQLKPKPAAAAAAATNPAVPGKDAAAGAAAGGKKGAAVAAKAPPVDAPVKQHTNAAANFVLPEKEHIYIDYENTHFPDIQSAFDNCVANIPQVDHGADILAITAERRDLAKRRSPSEQGDGKAEDLEPQQIDFQNVVEVEEQVFRNRLERLRQHAIEHLKELRNKGFDMYIQLDDWIGARFQAEMDAAKDMMNIIKEAIESEAKLPNQLVLEGEKFIVDFGMLTLEPEPEPRPESPVEKPMPDQFTVLQLANLARQLRILAPSGKISSKYFIDYIQRTAVLSAASDLLPENYCNADPQQFQQLCYILDPFETGYISWRKFLMLASRVLPSSMSSILQMKSEFDKMGHARGGKLTKEEYDRVTLWFEEDTSSKWDQSQIKAFDRCAKIKTALFYVFADAPASTPNGGGQLSTSAGGPFSPVLGTPAATAAQNLEGTAAAAATQGPDAGAAALSVGTPSNGSQAVASSQLLQSQAQVTASGAVPTTPSIAGQPTLTGSALSSTGLSAAAAQYPSSTLPNSPSSGEKPLQDRMSAEGRVQDAIILGEHDQMPDDGSLFDTLDFLACASLDETGLGGLEKAFCVFGNADGQCTAQNVFSALHHFLVLTETSHRLDPGDSIDDPFPMDTILRVFDEAKAKGGVLSFEAFTSTCEAIGSSALLSCPLFQIEDITVYGAQFAQ
ncbi:hypothetical protein BC831DRAFT_447306 [Entophlyctis helioformis]|nr:hypothetical protein BC831DRAFT_447306 [Entophlyctis helioformis]